MSDRQRDDGNGGNDTILTGGSGNDTGIGGQGGAACCGSDLRNSGGRAATNQNRQPMPAFEKNRAASSFNPQPTRTPISTFGVKAVAGSGPDVGV